MGWGLGERGAFCSNFFHLFIFLSVMDILLDRLLPMALIGVQRFFVKLLLVLSSWFSLDYM